MKKLLLILMAVLCQIVPAAGASIDDNFESGDFEYIVTATDEVTVIGLADGITELENPTIPDMVSYEDANYRVTGIGNYAFSDNKKLTGTLTIGENVKTIGDFAFSECSNITGDLIIPKSVVSIGNYAFSGCEGLDGSLTILTMGDTATIIGDLAFYNCKGFTGTLTLGENVTLIGNSAFRDSSFTGELKIPNSVQSIGYQAFQDCKGFNSLTIGNSVETIGLAAFSGCTGFSGDLIIPNSVTSIGSYVFYGCSGFDGVLTIGDKVETIENYAFYSCSGLSGNLTIPNTVTSIGIGAFFGCRGFDGVLTIGDKVETIKENAFYGCRGFTGNLVIPNSVTSIGSYVFGVCSGFDGVLTIGDKVETIEENAFYGCSGLSGTLTIPNTVTSIGSRAFLGCSGFDALNIGNSVERLGSFAFGNCDNLQYILCLGTETVPAIEEDTFTGFSNNFYILAGSEEKYMSLEWSSYADKIQVMPSVNDTPIIFGDLNYQFASSETKEVEVIGLANEAATSISIPDNILVYDPAEGTLNQYSVTRIGDSVFENKTDLSGNLTIGKNVKTIGLFAFFGCSNLSGDLIIPNSVVSIGNCAFSGCEGLDGSLTIGDNVTTIGNSAFKDCKGFNSLTIGNSVETIGPEAFSDCTGFKGDLIIPNSVQSIGSLAFLECRGFNSLTIGNSVETIGSSAFSECCGFTGDLIIPNSVTSIGGYAFFGCNGFTGTLTISENVTSIEDNAFSVCSFSGELKIPDSVQSIGYQAFKACKDFRSLTIGNSVETIGPEAFMYCDGFTGDLIIPNSMTSIGRYAFYGCNGFTGDLVIPNSVVSIGTEGFSGCSGLNALTIGNSVERLGAFAFGNCYNLQYILCLGTETIPAIAEDTFTGFSNNFYIPAGSEENYMSLGWSCHEFQMVPYITFDNEGRVTIGDMAYKAVNNDGTLELTSLLDTDAKSITIPENITIHVYDPATGRIGEYIVTSIGAGAFVDCRSLESIICLGSGNILAVAEGAFDGFEGNIYVPEAAETRYLDYGWSLYADQIKPFGIKDENDIIAYGDLQYKNPSSESKEVNVTFVSNREVTAITIPEDIYIYDPASGSVDKYVVTAIAENAFWCCDNLISVVIPNSVKSIGYGAFSDCPSLKSIEIPSAVTEISDFAFYNCNGLETIGLPNSLTTIGAHAFAACSSLQNIDLPNSVMEIGISAFSDCSSLKAVEIPNSVTKLGDIAFYRCENLEYVSLSSSLTEIGEFVFRECINLQTIDIPNSITVIGNHAFSDCSSLPAIEIPNSVTEIREGAFSGCKSLQALELPNSLKFIGEGAFDNCISLESVNIPESVETIGDGAFFSCEKIKSITLPASLTSLEDAFYGCPSLTDINYFAKEPLRMEGAEVLNVNEDTKLHVWLGAKSKILEERLTPWCNFIEENIVEVSYGDFDLDGIVLINDAIKVANYAVGNDIDGDFIEELADANDDGAITISDAVGTVDIALSQAPAATIAKIRAAEDAEDSPADRLILGEIRPEGSGSYAIDVELDNTLGYVALQADLYLPEGIKLESVSNGQRSAAHTVMFREVAENVCRIVAFNFSGVEFAGGNGSVMTLHLTADSDADGTIIMKNTLASDARGKHHLLRADQTEVSGVGNVNAACETGISIEGGDLIISGAEGKQMAIYTTDGKLVDKRTVSGGTQRISLGAGIYIVVVGDSSRKITVK